MRSGVRSEVTRGVMHSTGGGTRDGDLRGRRGVPVA